MTRRFLIASPDELDSLAQFAKDGNIPRAARIWRTAQAKKGTKGTPWDGKVFADYCAYDGAREAMVILLGHDGAVLRLFAHMRYNLALSWCREHLKEIK